MTKLGKYMKRPGELAINNTPANGSKEEEPQTSTNRFVANYK